METVTLSKEEFNQMKQELNTLKETEIYKRLLEFEENIKQKKFSRKDLGF